MKKHYLIYQITNNVNGKIYIGKHEMFNVDDNYFGSGKYLNLAIKKYGLENFTKTILFELQNREEMNLLEKLVVTPEFCARKDTYNINVGGDGGWYYSNKQSNCSIQRSTAGKNGRAKLWQKAKAAGYTSLIAYQNRHKTNDQLNAINKKQRLNHKIAMSKLDRSGNKNPMYQHKYTKEQIEHLRSAKLGKNNNRYGSKWYYDPITFKSQAFLPNEKVPENWIPGRKMKRNIAVTQQVEVIDSESIK